MFPSTRSPSPSMNACSSCKKQTIIHDLVRVHAKTWEDCLGGSTLEVCGGCLVGYDIPVLRPSNGFWEFGTVISHEQHRHQHQKQQRHQVEFIDKRKELVYVGNDPYEEYVDEMMPVIDSSKETSSSSFSKRNDSSYSTNSMDSTNQNQHRYWQQEDRHDVSLSPVMMEASKYHSYPASYLAQKCQYPCIDNPLINATSKYHYRDPSSLTEDFPRVDSPLINEKPALDFSADQSHQTPIIRRSPMGKTVEPNSPFDSQISFLSTNSPARSSTSLDGRESHGSSVTSSFRSPRLWTLEEDKLLLEVIDSMKNNFCWPEIALDVPDRTGKQCRERYLNHLGPHLKHTAWTALEDATIFRIHASYGSKWSQMVKFLPGRTDNGIKNRYHHLRRRFQKRVKSVDDSQELKMLMKQIIESLSCQNLSPDIFVVKDTALRILNETSNASKSFKGPITADGEYEFGPFHRVEESLGCGRCGLVIPSKETGSSVCSKTGWCKTCTGVSVVVSGDLLRLLHLVK